MDPETRATLEAIRADVEAIRAELDQWLPLVRAYLDPTQEGPRGFLLRRQLAKQNGRGHG